MILSLFFDFRDCVILGMLLSGKSCESKMHPVIKLLQSCVREGWSVRETERQCRALPVSSDGVAVSSGVVKEPRTPHVVDLEKRLAQHLGTKVGISLGRQKGRGRVTIEFFSLEQFDGVLQKIGFDPNATDD